MKYLKKFNNETEYNTFVGSEQYITPNLCAIVETNECKINKFVPPPINLCDIAYWDGSSVKTVAKDNWDASLGTPVGVVVIPEGMLPDGKARMVSLVCCTKNIYGPSGTDTSLTNYDRLPTTDNSGSTSTGSNSYGCLPVDHNTGIQSFVDPKAKYFYEANRFSFVPSPYLGNDKTLNPEYCKEISGYKNVLSDFNGLTNTQALVGLDEDYNAAEYAWTYRDGVSDYQWYLPAMGELAFLAPRFNEINEAISMVGGTVIAPEHNYWGSSEYSSTEAGIFGAYNGMVSSINKYAAFEVRPFACI